MAGTGNRATMWRGLGTGPWGTGQPCGGDRLQRMEAHLVSRVFNIIRAYLNHSPYHLTATEEEEAPFSV